MNTQQLECFVRIADKLNFTKVAEELYITAPAVAHHIINLEELNTSLFIRTSKMVKSTEPGSLFYSEAKDILQKIYMVEKKVKKLASQKLSILRIGCSSQVELEILEIPLIKLREEFPTVYPQIIIKDYFILKSLFDNKQLYILISTKEMIAEAHDYIFKKIKNISSYAIIAENSPFAKEKEICFIDLYDTPLTTLHPRFIPF